MTATLRTARKPRPCGQYRCPNTINPGDRFVRHVMFPGQEGAEERTRPWVLEQCTVCVDRDLSYVADRYELPGLRFGARLLYRGVPHVVVGAADGEILVQADSGGRVVSTHPKWQTEYPAVEVVA